ncbi:MAG TPA: imidazolonepropionase [Marmoricola sp.]|nr:imidazolonepropionase [Marmoricola sp.]
MAEPTTVDLVVSGAAELLTCSAGAPDLIGCTSGGVAVHEGRIVAVGDVSGYVGRETVDASGKVVLPGFVDAHTHVVFGGSRVEEYAASVGGLPVPDGVPRGITGTAATTRSRSVDGLVAEAGPRLLEMLAHGTTTVESKSGYGLEVQAERRLLLANRALADEVPMSVVSTYLGAHAFPPDLAPDLWVERILRQLPRVAAEGLATFNDVYCDEGYFDLDQTRRILETGLEHGLRAKLHLDAYSHTGAADLAIELGAVSVDHLNFTTPAEARRLAAAGIPGVYMPCLDYTVAHPRPVRARELAAEGLELALATDVCPGCWTTSMQLAIAMACRAGGLSVPQAVRAATYGAARALALEEEVGSLAPGLRADLLVLDLPSHEHLAYRLGRNSVETVIKDGRILKEATR